MSSKENLPIKRVPIHCGQDLKDLTGYEIMNVITNEYDLDVRVVLQNKISNNVAVLELDNLTLDGETMFLRKIRKENF